MRQVALFTALNVLSSSMVVAAPLSPNSLEKRVTHYGRGTWFNVGLGACDKWNTNSDHIVALQTEMFTSGNFCDRGLLITANGKEYYATVRDECPGCSGKYDLDMSLGLFEEFADPSVGVLNIAWHFLPTSYGTVADDN